VFCERYPFEIADEECKTPPVNISTGMMAESDVQTNNWKCTTARICSEALE